VQQCVWYPGTIWLEDLSTNGTFIKDQKIGKGNKVQIPSGTEVCDS